MTTPRSARDGGQRDSAKARTTLRLRDLLPGDQESIYYAPRLGDWALLILLVVILLGNGLYVWHQLGMESRVGRAVFFGLLLFCVFWGALVYAFKISVSVRVGPHGLAIVRGPWRTELDWSDVGRLVERMQMVNRRRYRWVVALARDGRQMQVREDMVSDYLRFRMEVYERERQWEDHGGTWGATGQGPYHAADEVSDEVAWWLIGAGIFLLPGLYFWLLLPELGGVGPALVALALACAALAGRASLRRQRYTVDSWLIEARKPLRRVRRLDWREVARVERARHPVSGVLTLGIVLGQGLLALAARSDRRVQSFRWSPRVPEYLIVRGGGRHVRVRLHRLARPDELLAWVEFYERVGRQGGARDRARTASRPAPRWPELPTAPLDLTPNGGPADPWGAGRAGEQPAGTSQPGAAASPHAASMPSGAPLAGHHGPPAGYVPAPRPTDHGTLAHLPAAEASAVEEDAWLRETQAHLRASLPGVPPAPADRSAGAGRPTSPPRPRAPSRPITQAPPQAPPQPPSQPPAGARGAPDHPMEWDFPDQPPAPDEAAPTPAAGMAEAFQSWQADNTSAGEPPRLPRFGPPTGDERR